MTNIINNETFVGYVPVIHKGYVNLFARHPEATLGVLGPEILSDFSYLRKDIRALEPEQIVTLLQRGMGRNAFVLSRDTLSDVMASSPNIIMPDDDVTAGLLEQYPDTTATTEPVFLRWDRKNANSSQEVIPDRTITDKELIPEIITELQRAADKSSNWWRSVGAAVFNKDHVLTISHNHSLPTEHTSWIDGDPRITEKKGQGIDISIDIHAEQEALMQLLKNNENIDGCHIIATTFPCPSCAKLIALSGIKTCYFIEGYATLDGAKVLRDFGVEIVKITTETPFDQTDEQRLVPYPAS